eukprot:4452279-Pleurochrysis_carterae.AAC.1
MSGGSTGPTQSRPRIPPPPRHPWRELHEAGRPAAPSGSSAPCAGPRGHINTTCTSCARGHRLILRRAL